MKNNLVIVVCLLLSVGCSKKEEECIEMTKVVEGYSNRLDAIDTTLENRDAASLIAASKKADTSSSTIKLVKMEMNVLPLTDETLLSLKKKTLPHFDNTVTLLNEWGRQLLQAVRVETSAGSLRNALDKAKADIGSVCDEKIRRRRTRLKKNKTCRKIHKVVDNLSLDMASAEKLDGIKKELTDISNEYDPLKPPVEQLGETLDKIGAFFQSRNDMNKKIKSAEAKLKQHQETFAPMKGEIEAYCSSK